MGSVSRERFLCGCLILELSWVEVHLHLPLFFHRFQTDPSIFTALHGWERSCLFLLSIPLFMSISSLSPSLQRNTTQQLSQFIQISSFLDLASLILLSEMTVEIFNIPFITSSPNSLTTSHSHLYPLFFIDKIQIPATPPCNALYLLQTPFYWVWLEYLFLTFPTKWPIRVFLLISWNVCACSHFSSRLRAHVTLLLKHWCTKLSMLSL